MAIYKNMLQDAEEVEVVSPLDWGPHSYLDQTKSLPPQPALLQ